MQEANKTMFEFLQILDFILCRNVYKTLSTSKLRGMQVWRYLKDEQNDNIISNDTISTDIHRSVHVRLQKYIHDMLISSKIEKVARGIQGEKSSKDMASSRNLVSSI